MIDIIDMPSAEVISRCIAGTLAAVCFLTALFLLVFQKPLEDFNEATKKWISTRRFTRILDVMRDMDVQILTMRKALGAISLILAVVLFYLYMKF